MEPLNKKPILPHTLSGSIASISGDWQEAVQSIKALLLEIAGFREFRIIEKSNPGPALRFLAEISSTGQFAGVTAIPDPTFSDKDWQVVVSVIAGSLDRIASEEFNADNGKQLPSENLDSVLIVKDQRGRFLHVNEAFAELYDTKPSLMIGKTDADFHRSQDRFERFFNDDQKALATGEPVYIPCEENTFRRSGEAVAFETTKIPLKNKAGDFDRVLIVANPLTKKKHFDVSLAYQNSFLFKVIDHTPNTIMVKDRDSRFVFVNETAAKLLGKTKPEIIGKTISEVIPGVEDNLDDTKVIETREEQLIPEHETVSADGQHHWFQISKRPIIEPDGSCDKVLIVGVNIDKQIEAKQRAELNEIFLREVIDCNPNLILVKDRDGEIHLANRTVADFYGTEVANIEGKTDADFNDSAEELERFRRDDLRVLDSAEELTINERVTDSEGRAHWFQTIKKPVSSSLETQSRLLVVCNDISEQVRSHDELRQTKERAERANAAKTDFLTRMSHELRTPLNAILGFTQLLQQDDELSKGQKETIDIVNQSGKHLLNLISDVLEMSKVEMGEIELNESKMNLHQLLTDAIDLFEARAAANDCKLSLEIAAEVPRYILGDQVKLRQVVMNLISNAVKFTSDGSVDLYVSAAKALKFVVKDEGPGIDEEEISLIFEPFRQTTTGQSIDEGAGIGLCICQRLIQKMGGTISVESKKGKGSVFFFEIPLVAIEEDAQYNDTGVKASEPTEQHSGEGLTVLVADDAEVNRVFLKRLLDRLGYSVIEAENGLETVDYHLQYQPDLILMDVKMPEMDGMTATLTIRNNEQELGLERVPIIAITANAFEEHRRRAAEVGCDDFITKPFEFKDLLTSISSHVSGLHN